MNSLYDIARRSRAPMQTGVKPVTNQGSYRTPTGIAAPPQEQKQEDPGASAVKLGGILGKAYKDWRKMDEARQAEEAWGKTMWPQQQPDAATRFGQSQLREYLNGEGAPAGTPPVENVGNALPDTTLTGGTGPNAGVNAALGDAALNGAPKTDLGALSQAVPGEASALGDASALGGGAASTVPGMNAQDFGGLLAKFQIAPDALGGVPSVEIPGELLQNPLAQGADAAADAAGAASSLPGVGQVLGAGSAAMNLANGDYVNAGLDAAKVALLSAGPYGALGSLGIQAGQTLGDLTGWW